jgi:superfamily II DNA or RNA helicase
MRKLRNKAKRNALWIAAEGKCCLCRRELSPQWDADHLVPYSVVNNTNVHDMQALCGRCNRRKSDIMLREHQRDFEALCRQIASGGTPIPEFVFAHVAPGGGKSSLPVLAAHWLINRGKMAEKVCWVVPNGALREQGTKAFGKDRWEARYLGHNLELHESTNSQNPSKETAGYITTYQALRCDAAGINRDEFRRHQYALILDEFHHLAEGSPYHKAVEPLVELATLVIGMTGTVDRGDRRPIYLLPYLSDGRVWKEDSPEIRWVNYSVRQATREKAIIQVHFDHVDGAAKWYGGDGRIQEAHRLGGNREALFSALRTEYARQLLDHCLDHWRQRQKWNRRSKMLVVCADTGQAKQMLGHLKAKGVHDAELATYKEDTADDSIRRYREQNKPDLLVTVAKAYEGLDVPAITHLACLTHIRSRPWIEQMLARGWRYDPLAGPWEGQIFYAFVPADEAMQKCIKAVEQEQQEAVKQIQNQFGEERGEKNEKTLGDPNPCVITPLTSAVTTHSASELNGETMSALETEYYRQLAEKHHVPVSPLQLKRLLESAQTFRETNWLPEPWSEAPEPTVTHRTSALRKKLAELVRLAAGGDGETCKQINSSLKHLYGPREAMTEEDLIAAIQHMRKAYESKFRCGHAHDDIV